jgi:hypothetical protein
MCLRSCSANCKRDPGRFGPRFSAESLKALAEQGITAVLEARGKRKSGESDELAANAVREQPIESGLSWDQVVDSALCTVDRGPHPMDVSISDDAVNGNVGKPVDSEGRGVKGRQKALFVLHETVCQTAAHTAVDETIDTVGGGVGSRRASRRPDRCDSRDAIQEP